MRRYAILGLLLVACRGDVTAEPPIHMPPWDDMYTQKKFHPQGESALFDDKRAMRRPWKAPSLSAICARTTLSTAAKTPTAASSPRRR